MLPNHIFMHVCREMLYRLCSLQTNLYISLHHQSDVLLHQGTTFEELLLSSEIRTAMEKQSEKGRSEQVSLTQRVTKCQDDLM